MNILNVFRGLKKIQATLSTSLQLGTDVLLSGDTIEYDGDSILTGSQVFLKSAAGDYSVLPDGTYTTKTNILFNIKDGVVDTVNTTAETIPPVNKNPDPIKQAQGKVKADDTAVNDAAEPDSKATLPTEDEPETDSPNDDADEDAKQINDAITAALAPVWDAINQLTNSLSMSSEKTKEFQTNLSKVSEKVEKIAKTPATEPAEGAVNAFAAKQEIKDSKIKKAMSILHGTN